MRTRPSIVRGRPSLASPPRPSLIGGNRGQAPGRKGRPSDECEAGTLDPEKRHDIRGFGVVKSKVVALKDDQRSLAKMSESCCSLSGPNWVWATRPPRSTITVNGNAMIELPSDFDNSIAP